MAHHRILASYRGYDFFDGDRDCGYGGYRYTGATRYVAEAMCSEYGLGGGSRVLQLNSEKGFLLYEFTQTGLSIELTGVEPSRYAREKSLIKGLPSIPPVTEMYDLIIAIGVVYTLNLADAIQCLRNIDKWGWRAFITLASYDGPEDYDLMRRWTLLGTLLLKREEWVEVMKHAGYEGDYQFLDAKSLGLSA